MRGSSFSSQHTSHPSTEMDMTTLSSANFPSIRASETAMVSLDTNLIKHKAQNVQAHHRKCATTTSVYPARCGPKNSGNQQQTFLLTLPIENLHIVL